MIIVFDLDDTLYDEKTFFHSGMNAIVDYLSNEYGIPKKNLLRFLKKRIKQKRIQIIDDLLKNFNIYSKTKVKKCLSIYRKHSPKIQLSNDAKSCLKNLKKFSCYIVTDGNKIVQLNKIRALKLEKLMKKCFLTSNYGLKNAKPSPYCFMKICNLENVKPQDIMYVGDNPNKDFIGIKPLGFKTIRVLTGRYKNLKKSKKFESEIAINSLSKLTPQFIRKFQN